MEVRIMLNGLPGKMATLIQRSLPSDRYRLIPFGLTGEDTPTGLYAGLYRPSEKDEVAKILDKNYQIDTVIAVDFTHPEAVEENVRFYCEHNIPFVMGTTGGNRDILPKLVEAWRISAVIAPNMSVPIVMFMDMIEYVAKEYPNTLQDWKVRITESHQSGKKDVSGTALAVGEKLKKLGVNFAPENIRSVRDTIEQMFMGIPMTALEGHGWHKYQLLSSDGNVKLGFEHNINGRDTYVQGTILALDFLAARVKEGVQGKCYSMKDVLKG